MKEYVRTILDYPVKGIQFRDITTLLQNSKHFKKIIDLKTDPWRNEKIDAILSIESRGFIMAGAIAYNLHTSFIPLRKPNKLPYDVKQTSYDLEYGSASLEIHTDAAGANDNVLLVDDLIATGGTAEAAAKLIEMSNGKVAGYVFVINLFDLGGCDNLIKKGYTIENLMEFPGH